jgi:hypothetical protein
MNQTGSHVSKTEKLNMKTEKKHYKRSRTTSCRNDVHVRLQLAIYVDLCGRK